MFNEYVDTYGVRKGDRIIALRTLTYKVSITKGCVYTVRSMLTSSFVVIDDEGNKRLFSYASFKVQEQQLFSIIRLQREGKIKTFLDE